MYSFGNRISWVRLLLFIYGLLIISNEAQDYYFGQQIQNGVRASPIYLQNRQHNYPAPPIPLGYQPPPAPPLTKEYANNNYESNNVYPQLNVLTFNQPQLNSQPRWPSQQPQFQKDGKPQSQIEVRPAQEPLLINALIQVFAHNSLNGQLNKHLNENPQNEIITLVEGHTITSTDRLQSKPEILDRNALEGTNRITLVKQLDTKAKIFIPNQVAKNYPRSVVSVKAFAATNSSGISKTELEAELNKELETSIPMIIEELDKAVAANQQKSKAILQTTENPEDEFDKSTTKPLIVFTTTTSLPTEKTTTLTPKIVSRIPEAEGDDNQQIASTKLIIETNHKTSSHREKVQKPTTTEIPIITFETQPPSFIIVTPSIEHTTVPKILDTTDLDNIQTSQHTKPTASKIIEQITKNSDISTTLNYIEEQTTTQKDLSTKLETTELPKIETKTPTEDANAVTTEITQQTNQNIPEMQTTEETSQTSLNSKTILPTENLETTTILPANIIPQNSEQTQKTEETTENLRNQVSELTTIFSVEESTQNIISTVPETASSVVTEILNDLSTTQSQYVTEFISSLETSAILNDILTTQISVDNNKEFVTTTNSADTLNINTEQSHIILETKKENADVCENDSKSSDGLMGDILFLLDSSTNVGEDRFQRSVQLIHDTVSHFSTFGPKGIQVNLFRLLLYFLGFLNTIQSRTIPRIFI